MPNIQFIDMQDKSLNLQTAIFLVEVNVSNAGISFPNLFLDFAENELETKCQSHN
jgi:hypothetical protein